MGVSFIGEASNNIRKRYPDIPRRFPTVPFGSAYEMRNVVALRYSEAEIRRCLIDVELHRAGWVLLGNQACNAF